MKIDGDIAELLGIHIGDGCISENQRYSEYYLGGDINEEREYHQKWVSKLFHKKVTSILKKNKPNYKLHPKVGVYGFYSFDKDIVNFFKNLGIKSGSKINVEIPKYILKDKILLKRFLRGLFDTDGTIYFNKNPASKNPINNCPVIKLGTVSKTLAEQVFNGLFSIGFHPGKKKPYKGKRDMHKVYSVTLYRRDDIKRFIKEIGFKNYKHSTKWSIFKKLGYCPPKTTITQRRKILA